MIGDRLIKNSLNMPKIIHDSPVQKRLMICMASYIFLLLMLLAKLLGISILPEISYNNSYYTPMNSINERGYIYDRNGNILATNIDTYSLYALPKHLDNIELMVGKLAKIIKINDKKALIAKLKQRKNFTWIKRNLSPNLRKKILTLGIAGLEFKKQSRRFYPYANLSSHIIGYVDDNNNGRHGLESSFNNYLLSGSDDRLTNGSDKAQNRHIHTTVDIKLQGAVHEILMRTIKEFKATAANAIVMDVRTGEILSMVSLPTFNANALIAPKNKKMFDRNTMAVLESGSIHKVLTVAMALDSGEINLASRYDARKPIRIDNRYTVNDYRGQARWLNVEEMFMYSSNLAIIKMMKQIGNERHLGFLNKIGILEDVEFELPNAAPMYSPYFTAVDSLTASYGYGIATTPLGFLRAANAIINDGCIVNPTLVFRAPQLNASNQLLKQVNAHNHNGQQLFKHTIAKDTSATMRKLMHMVSIKGSAKQAAKYTRDYYIGAKTGTANYSVKGGYDKNRVRTSFFGFIGTHLNQPRYCVLVNLEEPQATKQTYGFTTAGWNAAKAGGQILQATALALHLPANHEKYKTKKILF